MIKKPCAKAGCSKLVPSGTTYCDEHKKEYDKKVEKRRGSAHQRGYTSRWQQYSKWFLRQPENQFCVLQLPGCNNLSECVDHVQAHNGPNDPLFWDKNNHQPACIHCNSVKGNKTIVGKAHPFESKLRSVNND